MKTYEIKTVSTITQENVDDLLATAFEGGITYWCGEIRVKKGCDPDNDDIYKSEVLTRGGALELLDVEENIWHTLTLDNVLKGIEESQFDFKNYDALDADVVVQRAIFGEVIYG